MQLTASARREVVEEILDIKIFSLMNYYLKQRVKNNKERSRDISYEKDLLEHKIKLQNDKITEAKEKSKTSLKALEKKMKKNYDDMAKLETEVECLKEKVREWTHDVLPKQVRLDNDRIELKNIKYKMDHKSSKAKQEIDFFKSNDECPTCEQHIDEEFKSKAIEERTNKMITSACTLTEIDARLKEMDDRIKLYEQIAEDNREHEVNAAKKTTSVESILDYSDQVKKQISEIHTTGLFLEEDKDTVAGVP